MNCPVCEKELVQRGSHYDCPQCGRTILGCCEGEPTPVKDEEEDNGEYGHDRDY